MPRPQERRALSAGSGVIIDASKGYVVTNHHVVKNADQIAVTLKDGRQVSARLIGSDAGTDIALVKVDASGLSAVALGNSDNLKVGDVVLAIGNPFGLGQTVTSGIVSALGRSGLSAEAYEDFIQTDAPINPGSSGGALIDSKGELVGINSAIIAAAGGNVGDEILRVDVVFEGTLKEADARLAAGAARHIRPVLEENDADLFPLLSFVSKLDYDRGRGRRASH